MRDRYGRNIDYMRISITDRCNLRCRYCMPEGVNLISMDEILRYEEICQVCKEAVALGITKYKITGGEPLVRKGCGELIRLIKEIKGVEQVTLTTNGILLKDHIKELQEAGLDGINISLDALDEKLYQDITGYDKVKEVLVGIEAAVAAGFKVKINCVLQKGVNQSQWMDVLELGKKYPVDVRFIELMPIGEGKALKPVSNEWILGQVKETYGEVEKDTRVHGNGPAVYYQIPGFKGCLGLISAIHGKFCGSCNRIRMTSTGELKSCLCFENDISIREAVRSGEMDRVRRLLEQVIFHKPQMHRFEELKDITENKKMVQIGG